VYDYGARYTAGATDYFAPARLDPIVTERVRAVAADAFVALGTRDVGRIDMIVADGEPQVLEGNVSPGMTETSLVPMAAQAAGLSLEQLCDSIIRSVTAR
jgi:D-alanine-D-alanine ligase